MFKKNNDFDRVRFFKHKGEKMPVLYLFNLRGHRKVKDLYDCIGIKEPYSKDVSILRFGSTNVKPCEPSKKLKPGDAIYYYIKKNKKKIPTGTERWEFMISGKSVPKIVDCKHKINQGLKEESNVAKAVYNQTMDGIRKRGSNVRENERKAKAGDNLRKTENKINGEFTKKNKELKSNRKRDVRKVRDAHDKKIEKSKRDRDKKLENANKKAEKKINEPKSGVRSLFGLLRGDKKVQSFRVL